MKLTPSGSQTVGPYFRIGLEHLYAGEMSADAADAVTITGRILDGNGDPVPDAMLEFWHADRDARYERNPAEATGRPAGFARVATGDDGRFQFATVKPGAVHGGKATQAPHIAVLVFARGLLRHLITRMYFPDDPANGADPILQSIPEERRHTLIARQSSGQRGVLNWDIVLQGKDETVFFAW